MYYAIGDVHGEISKLKELYEGILEHISSTDDPMGARIVFLGDYIDRGEDSIAVLKFLMNLNEDTDTLKHTFIKGNHEDLMLTTFEERGGMSGRVWLSNGGLTTFRDLGVERDDIMTVIQEPTDEMKSYIKWMDNLELYLKTVDYVFCHGGLDTRIPVEENKAETFMWKRTFNPIGEYEDYNRIVVHGHTPTDDNKPAYGLNEINVDTWACGGGDLTCVVLPFIYDWDTEYEFITA